MLRKGSGFGKLGREKGVSKKAKPKVLAKDDQGI